MDYLLQPKLSTFFPVGELWNKRKKAYRDLKKYGPLPLEFMLTLLGQASRLCPHVSESLKHTHPGGFSLDARGAYAFLREYAPLLRGASVSYTHLTLPTN